MRIKKYTQQQFAKDVNAAKQRLFKRIAKHYISLEDGDDAYLYDYLYSWQWGISLPGYVWVKCRYRMNDAETYWSEPIEFTNY